MRLCSVENCDNKYFGNGYCNKHYTQVRKYGRIISTNQRSQKDPNEIIIDGNVCRIKTYDINGTEVAEIITDVKYKKDVELLKWHISPKGYAEANWCDINNKWQKVKLHQWIFHLSGQEVPDGCEIDHKDGNKLNCLENNLRICTPLQNQHNKRKKKTNISGSIGVHWSKRSRKWIAQICINYNIIHLGSFDNKEDAIKAYNTAAIKYHGEFAVLNEV
jgi:hypothetical protein